MAGRKLLVVCLLFLNTFLVLAYVTDSSIYPPPSDYLNPTLPGVGWPKRFRDPTFYRRKAGDEWIWRISDARNTPRVDGVPGNLTVIQHEYSTTNPFNLDESLLLLVHQAYFALHDGNGRFIRSLLQVCPTCAPRWSRTDPDVFYYVRGLQMYRYNALTDMHEPHGGPLPYDQLITRGEDDICFDGDHRVGFGRRGSEYFLYVFSISQAQVVSELSIGGSAAFANVDSAEIAPDDVVLVTYVANDQFANQLPAHGIWAYNLNLQPLQQVSTAGGHHDVGRDADGAPILVMSNAASYHALPGCANGIERVSIHSPANRTCLLSLNWTLAANVSLPDQPGWAFVSTYAPGDPIHGGLSRKEESSPWVRSTGGAGWLVETNSVHSGGKAMWSDNDASQAALVFYGTKVQWIAYKDASSGIAQVSVDGETSEVDLYSPSPQTQTVVYSRDGLPLGFHLFTIDVTASKNPESSGYKIWVDAIEDDTPWSAYSSEILQVRLDGGEVRRIAHHRSRSFNQYNYTPRASVSRSGLRLVFGTNWGLPSEAYTEYADVYMIRLSRR